MVGTPHDSTVRAILYAFAANFGIAIAQINALERKLKARIPKLAWCFVEPDVED